MFTHGRLIAAASALMVAVVGGLQAQQRDTSRAARDTAGMAGMMDMGAMRGMHGGRGGMEGMMGMMGMMEECPMMRGMTGSPGAILQHRDSLGLSDEQVRRLEALRDGARKDMREAMTDMLAARSALREVVAAQQLDEAGARAALERMGRAHTDMGLTMLRSRRDALAVLTAAQRKQFDKVAGSMMGMMPMMDMMRK